MMGDAISLGIDLGTQSVRAMAVSAMGEVLGLGSQPLTSHRDGARHEQEPEEWWTATAAACRVAMADLPRENIRGLAVDATSGTVLLVDDGGRALTRGVMYDDSRAADDFVRARQSRQHAIAELTASESLPSWNAAECFDWLMEEWNRLKR